MLRDARSALLRHRPGRRGRTEGRRDSSPAAAGHQPVRLYPFGRCGRWHRYGRCHRTSLLRQPAPFLEPFRQAQDLQGAVKLGRVAIEADSLRWLAPSDGPANLAEPAATKRRIPTVRATWGRPIDASWHPLSSRITAPVNAARHDESETGNPLSGSRIGVEQPVAQRSGHRQERDWLWLDRGRRNENTGRERGADTCRRPWRSRKRWNESSRAPGSPTRRGCPASCASSSRRRRQAAHPTSRVRRRCAGLRQGRVVRSSIDPTVRVEASKLRAKLTRYNETDGRRDRILIEIPKGHYSARIRIERRPSRTFRPMPTPLRRRTPSSTSGLPGSATPSLVRCRCGRLSHGVSSPSSVLRPWPGCWCRVGPVYPHLIPRSASISTHPIRSASATCARTDPRSFLLTAARSAFIGMDLDGRSAIWVRDLHELTAAKIDGTSGAAYPFWSPDGSQIAYFSEGKLKRVRINGGAPDVLDDAPLGRGGTWSTSGTILFVASPNDPLRIVGSDGNGQKSLADAAGGRTRHLRLHPMFLPDGRRFLFIKAGPIAPAGVPFVGALDDRRRDALFADHGNPLQPGLRRRRPRSLARLSAVCALLVVDGAARRCARPGGPRRGTTARRWRPFEPRAVEGRLFGIAERGTGLSGSRTDGRPLAGYDWRGHKIGDVSGSGSDRDVSLSPDGTMLAVQRFASSPNWSDIWIQDLTKGAESRLTLAGNPHYTPVWAPNGQGLFLWRAAATATACITAPCQSVSRDRCRKASMNSSPSAMRPPTGDGSDASTEPPPDISICGRCSWRTVHAPSRTR